jgi:hypothetical protein
MFSREPQASAGEALACGSRLNEKVEPWFWDIM